MKGNVGLLNGCTLYWETNEAGGRTYRSSEVNGGVVVWDTELVDESTLRQALRIEEWLHQGEVERQKTLQVTTTQTIRTCLERLRSRGL